jgi:hypothetical protein
MGIIIGCLSEGVMSNHTTFYFVSTCDLQILMKNTMYESLYVGMSVKRKSLATVIYISKYLVQLVSK